MHIGGIQQHALVHGGDASSAARRTEREAGSGVKKKAASGYAGVETEASGESQWMVSAWKGDSGSREGGQASGQAGGQAEATTGGAGKVGQPFEPMTSSRQNGLGEATGKRVSYWA